MAPSPAPVPSPLEPRPYRKAGKGARVGAFLIDYLVSLPLQAFGFIPFFGMLTPLFLGPYWIFRDRGGRSIGKRLLGLRVVNRETGEPVSEGRLARRNLKFGLPALFSLVPFMGGGITMTVLGAVIMTEVVSLLIRGDRFSDSGRPNTTVAED